jgi:hypothetical protein
LSPRQAETFFQLAAPEGLSSSAVVTCMPVSPFSTPHKALGTFLHALCKLKSAQKQARLERHDLSAPILDRASLRNSFFLQA